MEDNVKFLGDDGMLGMGFKERTICVYNTEGNVMELLSTRAQTQEVIDFLEECKKAMSTLSSFRTGANEAWYSRPLKSAASLFL